MEMVEKKGAVWENGGGEGKWEEETGEKINYEIPVVEIAKDPCT